MQAGMLGYKLKYQLIENFFIRLTKVVVLTFN